MAGGQIRVGTASSTRTAAGSARPVAGSMLYRRFSGGPSGAQEEAVMASMGAGHGCGRSDGSCEPSSPCSKSCRGSPSSVSVLAAGATRAEMFRQHRGGVACGGLLGCLLEASWWRGWQHQPSLASQICSC
jgi:hypothetical protein